MWELDICHPIMPIFNSKEETKMPPVLEQKNYLINGNLLQWDGPRMDILSPICYETEKGYEQIRLGSYPMLTEKESLQALDSAVKAYDNGKGQWPQLSVQSRIQYVLKFVKEMAHQRTTVVEYMMWEVGKNKKDSEKEFDRTVQYILDTVEALKNMDRINSRFENEEDIIAQIRRAPLGVCLCMGPYNYSLNELYTLLIPALLMGNTAIFKTPKLGILLHEPLLYAFKIFPAGVVNSIYGDGGQIISPLMNSGKIDVLAFIGTSKVADIIKKQHPKPHRLKCILGLESKNVGIILKDANMDVTISECALGALSFNGQRCTALKILFVEEDVYDTFLKKFCYAINNFKPGLPWEDNVSITPLPEPNKCQYLEGLVEDAKSLGATIANAGGGRYIGTFYTPAVLSGVTPKMRLWTEEQFGPIIPIVKFSNRQDPVDYLEQSNYGQQVSIFSQDPDQIAFYVDRLVNQVCRVNINCQCQRGPDTFPFTGRKDSAEGTLSVTDALKVFSIRTLVAAKATDINKAIVSDILRDRSSLFLSTDWLF